MASIFSKIIAGEIPSYKIAEDDMFYAFLDIFPMAEGHVLVVPKTEVDKFFDLQTEYLIGLEVPHAHMHLVPINSADDLNFTRPKLKLSQERFLEIQKLIQDNL
jgi:histidine triad (HIT) family protein